MAHEKTVTRTVGLTFFEGLTLVFVHAKLFNVIAWSWWVVVSPFLAQVALALLFMGLTFLLKVLQKLTASKKAQQQQLLMEAMMRQAEQAQRQ